MRSYVNKIRKNQLPRVYVKFVTWERLNFVVVFVIVRTKWMVRLLAEKPSGKVGNFNDGIFKNVSFSGKTYDRINTLLGKLSLFSYRNEKANNKKKNVV